LLYWVLRPWRQMFDFRGRATRREYWFFLVQLYAALMILGVVAASAMVRILQRPITRDMLSVPLLILSLLLLIPYLSASIRRIHDHDKTGWLFLLSLVPVAGWIFFLIMMLTPGTQGPNNYGADPRDRLDPAEDVIEVFS
jgi:uncharacterized membrane protein YhaH (DUF805 family)